MEELEPQIKAEIIKLSESKTTIWTIVEKTNTHVLQVVDVLKEAFGDCYNDYILRIPKRIFAEQEKEEIVALRKSGKTQKAIEETLNISDYHIRLILKEKLGDERFK